MELTVIVGAGQVDRELCPARAVVPGLTAATGARLHEVDTGRQIPCQVGAGEVAWLLSGLPRGQTRRYRLVVGGTAETEADGFGVKDQPGEALDFAVGGKLFTSYNYARTWHRPFFHPVVGPGGLRVTRSWPMEEEYEGPNESRDHPHHRGIFVAHGSINGVDDWSVDPRAGRILHLDFESIVGGPIYAAVQELLDWVDVRGVRIVSERRGITVYNLPGEERLIDLAVTLLPTRGAVKLGDTKEAGLVSVRVASSMEGKRGSGSIENGFGGKGEAETWGKPAPWCHYSGPVGSAIVGIGIFDHPSNPRFPTNWHVRDYGLMTANCFGYHDFFPGTSRDGSMMLRDGQQVTFRYRIYIHRGDTSAGRVADRWADFAAPPSVGVE